MPPSRGSSPPEDAAQEARFREIFCRVHASHLACIRDEWLMEACRDAGGAPVPRPISWSRRNGPWRRVEVLWVGAAPGNAGGKGSSPLGAHGTRIPFGGDVAGANLDVLLGSIGLDRNRTFITASLNQLPAAGGGEPTKQEMLAPVGRYASSLHLLRDTMLAAGPLLIVLLGNVALRATLAAAELDSLASTPALPSLERMRRAGIDRGVALSWPAERPPSERFRIEWRDAWPGAPLPSLLWLTHPSAQNMSPYARVDTAFHTRMLDARRQLRDAARRVLGIDPPPVRPSLPTDGIYALPEWRTLVGPRHATLDALWREKGV